MASKTQKTECIRKRKSSPNKVNLKVEQERVQKNFEVLAKVVDKA